MAGQRLRRVLVLQEHVLHRLAKRHPLDALRREIGAQFRTGDAPDLLAVGLEIDLIEPPAKTADHPVLEGVLGCRLKQTLAALPRVAARHAE